MWYSLWNWFFADRSIRPNNFRNIKRHFARHGFNHSAYLLVQAAHGKVCISADFYRRRYSLHHQFAQFLANLCGWASSTHDTRFLVISKLNEIYYLFVWIQFSIAPELLTVRGNPNATQWNAEDGYQSNGIASKMYPIRVFGTSMRDTLNVNLGILLDSYVHELCSEISIGFRLSLHSPNELPPVLHDFILIPPEHCSGNRMFTFNSNQVFWPHRKAYAVMGHIEEAAISKRSVSCAFSNRTVNRSVGWSV